MNIDTEIIALTAERILMKLCTEIEGNDITHSRFNCCMDYNEFWYRDFICRNYGTDMNYF